MTDEAGRIRGAYERYASDEASSRRWDPSNPGNALILRERAAAVERMLRRNGFWPPGPRDVLEVGCGSGRVLAGLHALGADPSSTVGIDLLRERLAEARLPPSTALLAADAVSLPFRDGAFRLVLLFTVFSSVLDASFARAIADEADRVLAPGGAVLVYDFRWPSPVNRQTRPVGRREVAALFPSYRADTMSLTVVPPLARRLGRTAGSLYPVLARVPAFRTHLLHLMSKTR